MEEATDWLSRLLEILPVSGRLELRCLYGAPWEVSYDRSPVGEMPYHVILGGEALLEARGGASSVRLHAGDIVVFRAAARIGCMTVAALCHCQTASSLS